MPALDTNVLVRYVVQDDSGQLAAAKRLIEHCVAKGRSLFVPVTVSLELEWVLRANFGCVKDDVLTVLSSLFSAAELNFESEPALEAALQLYREGSAEFADCLHIALATAAGEQPLWTFDKGASKVAGAQLIRSRWFAGGSVASHVDPGLGQPARRNQQALPRASVGS